jgi:hypothetical protein
VFHLSLTALISLQEQGIDGELHLSGSSPDLNEFTITIVDGELSMRISSSTAYVLDKVPATMWSLWALMRKLFDLE